MVSLSHRHKGSLEDVIGKEVPAKIEEVVDDVDLALLGLSRAERLLGLAVARVHEDDEHEADDGGDQRSHEEEAHGPQGDHSVHLGVQARGSCMNIDLPFNIPIFIQSVSQTTKSLFHNLSMRNTRVKVMNESAEQPKKGSII